MKGRLHVLMVWAVAGFSTAMLKGQIAPSAGPFNEGAGSVERGEE